MTHIIAFLVTAVARLRRLAWPNSRRTVRYRSRHTLRRTTPGGCYAPELVYRYRTQHRCDYLDGGHINTLTPALESLFSTLEVPTWSPTSSPLVTVTPTP